MPRHYWGFTRNEARPETLPDGSILCAHDHVPRTRRTTLHKHNLAARMAAWSGGHR
jgi:hypothetical protein